MSVSFGGAISNRGEAARLARDGADKVAINSALHDRSELVHDVTAIFGSQAVYASIDVGRSIFGKRHVISSGARRKNGARIEVKDRCFTEAGAGEIMLQGVDWAGMILDCDHDLLKSPGSAVSVPLVACGGAKAPPNLVRAVAEDGVSAAAPGDLFVVYVPHRAALVNPSSQNEFVVALAGRIGASRS